MLGLDIEVEHLAVHRAVDNPGCIQPVMAQRGDEGLGIPVAEGRMVDQTRPSGGHPVVLAMLVFSEVSSMNPMRGNRFAMNGWRRVIQT
ncbi:hypothetical protein [Paracoccus binzhouensis]|uniref:hypothetical protein n=1 Tax=Paracoccus binzhouensis TaxID=2796149 RepID=UPI0018EEF2AB|nr:hypothetical protein [Paracoccus binzhouensis]